MITDYTTLQAAVLSNMHREGDVTLLAEMPRFVQLAELEIFRELPLRQVESASPGTTSGAAIVIPPGTAQIERISINSNGRDYSLNYTSPNGIAGLSFVDLPTRYTIESGAIRLLSPPAANYAYTLFLIPDLTALSASNTTNWLLLNAPDVYLYAACIQAATWTGDNEMVAGFVPLYQRALDSIKRKDERKRFPASGGLQIKPRGFR